MKTLLTIAFLLAAAITSSAQIITAPRISLSGPGEFEAVITGSDFSNIAAYQMDIYYDPEVIALKYTDEAHNFGCATTGIGAGMAVQCNSYPDHLRVVVYGANGVYGTGDLVSTQWVTVESGYSDLHFAHAHLYSWSPYGEIPARWEDGSASIGNSVGVCSTGGC